MKYEVGFIEYNVNTNNVFNAEFNIKKFSKLNSAIRFIHNDVIAKVESIRNAHNFSCIKDMYEGKDENGLNYYVMLFDDDSSYKWVIIKTDVEEE